MGKLKMNNWNLNYTVTCDFLPYRYWTVKAESEIEARQIIATEQNVPLEQVSASITALTTSLYDHTRNY